MNNLHVWYLYKSESKGINTEESELHVCYMDNNKSKNYIVDACSLEKSESKSVHVSVNVSKLK